MRLCVPEHCDYLKALGWCDLLTFSHQRDIEGIAMSVNKTGVSLLFSFVNLSFCLNVRYSTVMVAGHRTDTLADQNGLFFFFGHLAKFFFIFLSSCLLLVPSLFRLWRTRSKWGRSPPLCPNKASTNLCSGPPHQVLTVTPVQRKSKTPPHTLSGNPGRAVFIFSPVNSIFMQVHVTSFHFQETM